jgi:uncharacterized protein
LSTVWSADDIMPSRLFRVGRSTTGLGLFATKPIKRAGYIASYRGRRISTEEADRLMARGATYIFELNSRWNIDGSPRWNVARYINHSCRPNARPVHRKGGIVIVALRRIEPGEEITYDWPAPGSEDTELGVFMGPEVGHGETKVYTGVQA